MAKPELLVVEDLADLPVSTAQPRIKPDHWKQDEWIASFYFIYADQIWCKRCGTQVLEPLIAQHYFELHQGGGL